MKSLQSRLWVCGSEENWGLTLDVLNSVLCSLSGGQRVPANVEFIIVQFTVCQACLVCLCAQAFRKFNTSLCSYLHIYFSILNVVSIAASWCKNKENFTLCAADKVWWGFECDILIENALSVFVRFGLACCVLIFNSVLIFGSFMDFRDILGSTHVVQQLLFFMFSLIVTFHFDLILGP